jgi:hypothetical protein
MPCFVELVAVEEPENDAHEEQDGLIERPRDRGQPKRPTPANRSRDSPVSNHDLDGADRASDEEARGSHAGQGSARLSGGCRRLHGPTGCGNRAGPSSGRHPPNGASLRTSVRDLAGLCLRPVPSCARRRQRDDRSGRGRRPRARRPSRCARASSPAPRVGAGQVRAGGPPLAWALLPRSHRRRPRRGAGCVGVPRRASRTSTGAGGPCARGSRPPSGPRTSRLGPKPMRCRSGAMLTGKI